LLFVHKWKFESQKKENVKNITILDLEKN